MNRSNF